MTTIWHSMSTAPRYSSAALVVAAAGARCGAGAGAASGGAVASPAVVSSVSSNAPSLTLSPTLTASDLTTPAAGAGTSIVALSDSSVTSESSTLTVSPGLTRTSITGTSVKSPMSGTLTSIVLIVSPIGSGSVVAIPAPATSSSDLARELAAEHPVPDRLRRRRFAAQVPVLRHGLAGLALRRITAADADQREFLRQAFRT